MEIRKAKPGDAENISKLTRALSRRFITGAFSSRGEQYLLDSMSPAVTKELMQKGYRYHVAEIEDNLVGVVAVRGNQHLYQLFVAEEHQRKGIARKLWEVAKEACLGDGHSGEFTVNSSEYALEVYKRLGFAPRGETRIKNGVVFYPMGMLVDRDDRTE